MNTIKQWVLFIIILFMTSYLVLNVIVSMFYNHVNDMQEQEKPIHHVIVERSSIPYGRISHKEEKDGLYTVEVSAYGRFLVSKEEYDSLLFGQLAPDWLIKRSMK